MKIKGLDDENSQIFITFETEYSKKGETRLLPYTGTTPQFRMQVLREVWVENGEERHRAYHIALQLGEDLILLSSHGIWDVIHQAAQHLALLAKAREE